MTATPQSQQDIDAQLREVFSHFPKIALVLLFGSVASGRQRADSDLDIAVAAKQALTVDEKIALVSAMAERTGRPIDLIDLNVASEPLLAQIVRHSRRVLGSDTLHGELISRHLFEQADFMPYRTRIIAERLMAWIGKIMSLLCRIETPIKSHLPPGDNQRLARISGFGRSHRGERCEHLGCG